MSVHEVAIIGAGLCGLALAIALKKNNIDCTIYEIRPENASKTPGAIMLSPNALRFLDAIGLYDRIKTQAYNFQMGYFRSNDHEIIDHYEMGNAQKYGYDAMRIYRRVLLEELRKMVKEAGAPILYGKKFSHIISEDDSEVRFACTNGDEHTASILVGADGIHSTVRRHLFPEVKTVFSGIISIITAIPTHKVKLPSEDYHLPVSVHGATGAFMLAPQGARGEELLLAFQNREIERDRAGWEALNNDKGYLVDVMRKGYDSWNSTVQNALDAVDPSTIFIWPFYSVPKLPTWRSERGNILMLGDAAHAIRKSRDVSTLVLSLTTTRLAPAAGQGINQGFEDVQALALLMASAQNGDAPWKDCLQWWQKYRQERVDGVTDLTNEMNRRRMPGWSGDGAGSIDNSWLYDVDIEKDVQSWIDSQRQ